MDEVKDHQLYPLDYRITNALHKDTRKTIWQVAEELEISARPVERRLDRLEASRLVAFSLEWCPGAFNDIITLFQMELRGGMTKWRPVSA